MQVILRMKRKNDVVSKESIIWRNMNFYEMYTRFAEIWSLVARRDSFVGTNCQKLGHGLMKKKSHVITTHEPRWSTTRRTPGRSFTKCRIEDISNGIGNQGYLWCVKAIRNFIEWSDLRFFNNGTDKFHAGDSIKRRRILFVGSSSIYRFTYFSLGDDAKSECGFCGFYDVPDARISSKYESRKTSSPFYK